MIIITLIFMYGVGSDNKSIKTASLVSIFILAIITIPVFLTGEPAEDTVEKLPGVLKSIIEEHEEAADFAFGAILLTGLLAAITIVLEILEYTSAKLFIKITLILSLLTCGIMARTGYLGGQIRHTEIRSTIPGSPIGQPSEENEKEN
jgi:nucleoside permease NupC